MNDQTQMSQSSPHKLRFGFRDLTIPMFAAANRSLFLKRSALVTCIDSCVTPASADGWIRLLSAHGVAFERSGNFVWLPSSQLTKCIEIPCAFTGFDEIYLVREKPTSVAAITTHFTSDGITFAEALPAEVEIQMQGVQADGYVSDGCGLNFVVSAEFDDDLSL